MRQMCVRCFRYGWVNRSMVHDNDLEQGHSSQRGDDSQHERTRQVITTATLCTCIIEAFWKRTVGISVVEVAETSIYRRSTHDFAIDCFSLRKM